MPSPNLSEMVTTTLRNRSSTIADNVTNNTALLMRLKERGNSRPFSGGRTIIENLDYAENATYKRYSGYETLNISPSDVISAAEFDIKQAAVAVTISGLEELQNSGREAVIDLLEARIKNAERTMMNNISNDIYSDGTADSGKQIGGLQSIVADSPTTGTVGGINRANFSFWQNQLYDFSVEGVTSSASTIQASMNALWLRTKRNRDVTDLIIFDDVYFTYYWSSLQANQRFTNEKMAEAGFHNLKFMQADVIPDGGQDGDSPASHGYFLNTNFIHYRPHRNRNMVPLNPDRQSTNQDAMVKIIGWAGNMTASNCALQGVMHE